MERIPGNPKPSAEFHRDANLNFSELGLQRPLYRCLLFLDSTDPLRARRMPRFLSSKSRCIRLPQSLPARTHKPALRGCPACKLESARLGGSGKHALNRTTVIAANSRAAELGGFHKSVIGWASDSERSAGQDDWADTSRAHRIFYGCYRSSGLTDKI